MTLSILNQIGPRLLRYGLSARYRLSGGILSDNPFLDGVCLLPVSQKIVEIDITNGMLTRQDNDPIPVLEDFLRPALLPNNKWSDVRQWQFHSRVMLWVRRLYLLHKYYYTIQPYQSPTKNDLPTTKSLMHALELQHWSLSKNRNRSQCDMQTLVEHLGGELLSFRGGSVAIAHLQHDDDTDLAQIPLGQVLELAGCFVLQAGPLNALCEHWQVYQVWTREYVAHLAQYLVQPSRRSHNTVVLDVHSGDCTLSNHLKQHLQSEPHMEVVALDNRNGIHSVEKALDKYKAQTVIVICSWMPPGEDWSDMFRKHKVSEYILIGECDDGRCGDNWATWGNEAFLHDADYDGSILESNSNDEKSDESKSELGNSTTSGGLVSGINKAPPSIAPYKVDGYVRKELRDLSKFQFSRFDCLTSKFGRTISFRRKGHS